MALLPILHYPDPRLHQSATPVTEFTAQLKQLAEDMTETMYAAPGVGLAAPQVNVHKRLVVIDVSEDKNALMVLVNPQILAQEGTQEYEEGCLSVPGVYSKITRAARVRVQAQNLDGEPFEIEADGLLAVCLQHEIDHLDGKVFVDYLSQLKQNRIRTKLLKQAREGARS
ncbi:MAG: peptide deformylase [Rhodocyclaceae bacterium]|nr:peptide deformylase [Rhodocyclaceae bacterium]MBR4877920.1 peptide deformylase [Rhodocyclaceae bacterium]